MDNDKIHIPIAELERRFKAILIRLPAIAGNTALNFFLDSFKNQGWLGNTLQPWLKRKDPTKWGQHPPRNGRALLVLTGKMRRATRITKVNQDTVGIGNDDPKAKAHNEGLRIGQIQKVGSYTRNTVGRKPATVKAHTRRINQNIPKRQFIGDSPYLTAQLKRIISAEIMKALRP